MPSGPKKRRALKKKKQQAITNNKDFNGHGKGNDELRSQDERENDGNLSSPSYQGNDEFWTRDSSSLSSLSALGNVTTNEKTEDVMIVFGRGTDHNTINATSQEAGAASIAHVVDSLKSASKAVISDQNEQVESSMGVEKCRLKGTNISRSLVETSGEIKSVECCDEVKGVLPYSQPVAGNSWLSCCGLFDVMTEFER